MNHQHPYLDLIATRVPIIFDGALGTEIQKALSASAQPSKNDFGGYDGCNEYLNISNPNLIEDIHIRYLEVGACVVETNTFGASRVKLNEFGLGDSTREINRAAAAIARSAIKKVGDDGSRFVCGSIGPTGFLPSSSDRELSGIDFDALLDIFKEQAAGLIEGGADLLLIETSQDLLEARAAIFAIRSLTKLMDKYVPLTVQITVDASGKTLLGGDISAFLGAVNGMGVDVVGLNCSCGPDEMAPYIYELLKKSTLPVSMLPNAGLPRNVNGKAVYDMHPAEFADKVSVFAAQYGVAVVGGCCGTSPEHIGALVKALDGVKVAANVRGSERRGCCLSTGISGVDLEQLRSPIIIGERLNAQGSKKTKEYLINRNFDELYQVAKEQIESKSDLIDISVAANELDVSEERMMGDVVEFLRDRVAVPFCIDSTDSAVLAAALKKIPGSALLNSINLEHGGVKARKILELAVSFGCPVIALTIDSAGMADTAERKFEVAKAIKNLACDEYNMPEHYVYIDPLVFTLATGDAATANAAVESLEALRRIKQEFPNIRTVMGVSNVSFGLKPKARRVLNNLMLCYAARAGLNAAIFNPHHIDDISKYETTLRELADDLLLNRRADSLQRFIEYFDDAIETSSENKVGVFADTNEAADNSALYFEQKLRLAVIDRDKRKLVETIEGLLKERGASDILNAILLPAMAEVGDRMAAGKMILPFVLQAAEVMKEAVSILEPHLKEGDDTIKGKIVIATVYGDVHDIGKNLVASILRNQGFEVIDLGKQVPIEAIVEAAMREKPDVIGLSALLVTTSQEMGKCAREFARLGMDIPIIIGGAAVNREFAKRISALDDSGNLYKGGVYYAKDAFGVVKIFDDIRKNVSLGSVSQDSETETSAKNGSHNAVVGANVKSCAKRELKYDYFIEPPFLGTGDILTWSAESLLLGLDRETLFKAWWGGGKLEKSGYESARKEEFEPAFERLFNEVVTNSLIDARAFYGFFSAISDDEEIIIIDSSTIGANDRLSFVFPRTSGGDSLADYIRPEGDVISAQAVTIGGKLGDRCRDLLLNKNRYGDGYYLNGLGSFLTETLADKVSGEIRRALGLPVSAGRRYSFGYHGMPNLEEQARLIEFLGAEERLGITLTAGFQMQPEHSTVAIFVHHPDAKYLS